jgi:hypothetical protein
VCATECPGNNLYAALPTIRQEVSKACSFITEPAPLATEPNEADWIVYPNPSRGTFFVKHQVIDPTQVRFELIDGLGRQWPVTAAQTSAEQWRISTDIPRAGFFWLRCFDGLTTVVRPLWYSQE